MTTAPTSRTFERPAQRTRPQLPRLRAVLMEQLRTIGFALRMPMLVAAALAVLVTLVLAIQIVSGDMQGSFLAEPSATPGVIGALLPIAVWAREERFGPGFLWTLPVDRSRHALIKVLAGWLWLMSGVALYALCLLVLTLVSEGGVLPVETLNVLTTAVPRSAPVDPAALRIVQWAPGALIWAVPFGGATATYLLASAFMLGARRPLRWMVGAVLLLPVSSLVSHMAGRVLGVQWLADAPERALVQLLEGRYGLDALLKLRTWTLDRRAVLPTGEGIEVWTAVPDLADWRTAALLWTGAGLLALWAAASRHRERRRR
jgi:hypothetical protein